MRAADIPDDVAIREVLACGGTGPDRWARLRDVARNLRLLIPGAGGMPEEEWRRVVRAKLRRLVRRGLIHGCACGCRGDLWVGPDSSLVSTHADGPCGVWVVECVGSETKPWVLRRDGGA